MSDNAIVARNVSKQFRLYHERNQYLKAAFLRGRRARYEEFWALKDVSFEIKKGEAFGIIGENGSGKSTMLKCVAQILRPDKGTIEVDGKMSALLELGAGFHPELSGRENVYLNGSILGLSKRELDGKFDEIVDFAGLERFIDTPVKNYSSGMYVRLGFAVAVNVDPAILVVDEVLAVGDENFQRKCAEKFADFRRSGQTIVLVSHGLSVVRAMCDRAAWLSHGELLEVGEPGHVIDAYSGTTHDDRAADEVEGTRWGSGEVRVTKIDLLDRDGKRVSRCHTGDAVTLRLNYNAHRPTPRPVIEVNIARVDGVHVTGPTTKDSGLVPEQFFGHGFVDVTFDPLMLLAGTYDVSVQITDENQLHVYDAWQLGFRFDVLRGVPHEQLGVVSLAPKWYVDALEEPEAIARAQRGA